MSWVVPYRYFIIHHSYILTGTYDSGILDGTSLPLTYMIDRD